VGNLFTMRLSNRFINIIVLLASCWLLLACQGQGDEPLPYTRVNVQVYLNTVENLRLLTPPNYIYIQNEGLRGIVLYSDTRDNYIALDRACTVNSGDTCARVTMDPSMLWYTCRCCGSRFGLQGEVQNGVATNRLRRYNVNVINPGVLLITN